MKTIVFLLTGRIDTIVSETDLGLRPGEAVVVRCTAGTTFEQILEEMMVGFGLVTDAKEAAELSAVALIRAVRFFLATLPPESIRPVLVLEDAGALARGIVERLRYLAPADGAAQTTATSGPAPDAVVAAVGADGRDHAPPGRPRGRWVAAAAAMVVVTAAPVPYLGTRTADHLEEIPTNQPEARTETWPIEAPLESSPGFLVRVATFRTSLRASAIARELEAGGVPAFVDSSGSSTYAVLAGPYASTGEAAPVLELVKRSFGDASIVAVP
jgi:cell division septation protein DedD